jgi:transposase
MDPLILSLPGVSPATGACIRAYFGDGSGFDSAKKAAIMSELPPRTGPSGR